MPTRSRPLKAIAALLVVLVIGVLAAAEHAPAKLDELAGVVDARVSDLEGAPLTKSQKRCFKALRKAQRLLAGARPTRADALDVFKKSVAVLRRCLPEEGGTAAAVQGVTDAFTVDLAGDRDGVAALVGRIESTKARKRADKLLAQTDKRLAKAAATLDARKTASQLAGAGKALDKLHAVVDDLPPVMTAEADLLVIVSGSFSADEGPYELSVTVGDPAPPAARALSDGTFPVTNVRTTSVADEPYLLFVEDGDLFGGSAIDPEAPPENLTADIPRLRDDEYFLAPDGSQAFVFVEGSGADFDAYVLHLRDGGADGVDVSDGDPVTAAWSADGSTCIASTNGGAPDFHGTLDLVTSGEGGSWTAAPVAGPAVDGTSAYDPAPSPSGTFVGYTCTEVSVGPTGFCILDTASGGTTRVSESIVSLQSSTDFLTARPVACTWAGDGFCVFDGVPAASLVALDVAEPRPASPSVTLTTVDDDGAFYTVCESNENDVVLVDTQDEEVIDIDVSAMLLADVDVTKMDTGFDPSCCYDASSRTLFYTKALGGTAPEVRAHDCATGADVLIATPETDASQFATTYLRDLSVRPIDVAHLLLTFDVVGEDVAVAGVHQGLVRRTETGYETPFLDRLVKQFEEDVVESLRVGTFLRSPGKGRAVVAAKRRSLLTGEADLVIADVEIDLENLGQPLTYGPEEGRPDTNGFGLDTIFLVLVR